VNEILMRAVVEAAAFFELSSDEVVDSDAAVKQLESMDALLRRLSAGEKRELVAFAEAEADRVSSDEYGEFLRHFTEAVGL
jgi:hypothetical protein